jgi:large subunit ribosomal protein L12
MEYIYAALLVHSTGKTVDEESVKAVLSAAGIAVNDSRVKALIAALDGVDIEEAIAKAATAPITVAATGGATTAPITTTVEETTAPEESKEEEEEDAMAGLGALFG